VMIAPQAQADPSPQTVTIAVPKTIEVMNPDGSITTRTVYVSERRLAPTPYDANLIKQAQRDAGNKANSSSVSYPGPKNPARTLP
jgi:hypothetical protein